MGDICQAKTDNINEDKGDNLSVLWRDFGLRTFQFPFDIEVHADFERGRFNFTPPPQGFANQ